MKLEAGWIWILILKQNSGATLLRIDLSSFPV